MSEKEEANPKLEFKDEGLAITYIYQRVQTKEGEEAGRRYYQEKRSRDLGREIPLEQIGWRPKEGEAFNVTTYFLVGSDHDLLDHNIMFWEMRQESTEALPKLVDKLKEYRQQLDWAIDQLNYFADPSREVPEDVVRHLDIKRRVL